MNKMKIVLVLSIICIVLSSFTLGAIWFGTSASLNNWGNILEPSNNSREWIDIPKEDFIFNTSASGIHNNSNLDDYVVGNWWFEKNGSDISGNGNDLTVSQLVENKTGIVGYAYDFTGTTTDTLYLTAGSGNPLVMNSTSFSVCTWFNTKGAGDENQQTMLDNERSGAIFEWRMGYLRGARTFGFTYYNGTSYSVSADLTSIQDNTWYYGCGTWDNSTGDLKTYINGVEDSSGTSGMAGTSTVGFRVSCKSANTHCFNGTIDEILIFNRSLSSSEISNIYNQSLYGEDGIQTRWIQNCSLLVNIDDAGYSINQTLTNDHNDSDLTEYVVLNMWLENNLSDISGNGNKGTWVNADGDENVTGLVGQGVEVKGNPSLDFFQVAWDTSLNLSYRNFSYGMWAKSNIASQPTSATLFRSTTDHLSLFATADDYACQIVLTDDSTATTTGTNSMYKGQWKHHMCVGNGTDLIHYIDGVEFSYDSYALPISGKSYNLNFGFEGASTRYFNGSMDEIIMFNRSLSSAEVSALYNSSKLDAGHNHTFSTTFKTEEHDIDWKVGCYDDLGIQWNSSEYYLEVSRNVTQYKPNIGAHAYYDKNYVVGMWRFEQENSSGHFAIDETGKNNGTINGDVKWCPDDGDSQAWNCSGRIGKGVLFEVDDGIVFGDPDNTLTDLGDATVSMWIKVKDFDTAQADRVFSVSSSASDRFGVISGYSAGDSNYLTIYNDIDNSNDGTAKCTSLNTNQWYHFVFTMDSSGIKPYLDGTICSGTSTSTKTFADIDDAAAYIALGKTAYAAAQYSNATIDEVTIWNRSLSAEEVAQLYYSSAETYNSTYTIQDLGASNNNTQDSDNDTIKFIYDWYVNNVSMAVLNMPFEAVNNGSEMNFTKDYSSNENHASTTSFDQASFNGDSGWNRTGGVDGFGAYEFDGAGDYIEFSNGITEAQYQITDPFTISTWVKPVTATNGVNYNIFSYRDYAGATYDGWEVYIDEDVNVVLGSSGADKYSIATSAVSTITAGVWQYITVTYDGSSDASGFTIYKNGASEAYAVADNDAGATITYTGNARIGTTTSTTLDFNGTIDEVLIFNRTLSAEQVLALYRNQTHIIKSQETQKGQSWKAEVTANDGYGDSTAYNTSEIVIDSVTLTVSNIFPTNFTNTSVSSVNFTYTVSDGDATNGINNCSLWLKKGSSWEKNSTKTNYISGDGTNLTFNLTVEDIRLNWTIGCYDKDNEQTNSTIWNLTVDSALPNMSLNSPSDEGSIIGTNFDLKYTPIDNLKIKNCTLTLIGGTGTQTRFKDHNLLTNNTQVTESFGGQDYATYTWYTTCYDFSENWARTERFTFTNYQSNSTAEGTTGGDKGGGGAAPTLTCPEGFNINETTGFCQEIEDISLIDLAEAQVEAVEKVQEVAKDVIQKVKINVETIIEIALYFINTGYLLYLFRRYKIRRKIKKGEFFRL